MKRTIYTPRRKPNKKWADQRKTPLLKVILGILGLVAGAYIGGQIAGYIDFWRRPMPSHYIVPVGNLRDIKVRDMKIQEGEWEWAEKHGEILRGNRLVAQAYAKEEAPKGDVEQMIVEAFGKDAKTALCIAKAESGINPTRENRGVASGKYKGECSIGLFQINLKSNGCTGRAVHWAKAKGETLEEKVEWLKVPENNIAVANQIFEASGWAPWSTKSKCI